VIEARFYLSAVLPHGFASCSSARLAAETVYILRQPNEQDPPTIPPFITAKAIFRLYIQGANGEKIAQEI